MGIVIEQRPSTFSGGALQSLGSIGTSALDAAVAGITASTKAIIDDGDKGIIDDGLKFFEGFDRNSFEFAKTAEKGLSTSFLNAAEYGKPTQILSDFIIKTQIKDSLYNDVVKKMEDPQFKIRDGLAKFAGKQIAKMLSKMAPAGAINGLYAQVDDRRGVFTADNRFAKLKKLEKAVLEQLDLFHFLKIRV